MGLIELLNTFLNWSEISSEKTESKSDVCGREYTRLTLTLCKVKNYIENKMLGHRFELYKSLPSEEYNSDISFLESIHTGFAT